MFSSELDYISSYLFNLDISAKLVSVYNKAVLLLGTNLRMDNPLLNLKIKRSVLSNHLACFAIGGNYYSSFPIESLGSPYILYIL